MQVGLRRVRGENELVRVDAITDLELRSIAVVEALQADRGAPLLVRGRDRLAFSQPTVEADREVPGCVVADGASHSYDAIDMCQQRLGLHLAVTGIEDGQLHRGAGSAERLLERCRRDELSSTIRPLEEQAVLIAVAAAISARRLIWSGLARLTTAAVSAEVDHRRLELAQLAE